MEDLPSLRTLSEQTLRHPNSDSVNYPLRDYINRYFGSIRSKPYTDENGDIIRDETDKEYILYETKRILDVLNETENKLKKKKIMFDLKTQEDKKHIY